MSTQRGNSKRTRAQKHKNRNAFKNDLHDTSEKTKLINSIQVQDVCARCKDIIDWRIKYKKYRPLTRPKTCTKCAQKSVKQAYHVICSECAHMSQVCAKCLQSKDIVNAAPPPAADDELQLDPEMKALLRALPERKRRTIMRFMNAKKTDGSKNNVDDHHRVQMNTIELLNMLRQLSVNVGDKRDDCMTFKFHDDDF